MALFDFLKNKEEAEKAKQAKKPAKASVAKKEVKKETKEEKTVASKSVSTKNIKPESFSYDVVKEPHISEKSTDLAEKSNQYVFKVIQGTNKTEIKKTIEGVYKVDVLSVNIIKIPAKKRRIGRNQGFKKGFTKAIVKVKDGQKIEII